jgi:hypothetical protein
MKHLLLAATSALVAGRAGNEIHELGESGMRTFQHAGVSQERIKRGTDIDEHVACTSACISERRISACYRGSSFRGPPRGGVRLWSPRQLWQQHLVYWSLIMTSCVFYVWFWFWCLSRAKWMVGERDLYLRLV